MNKKRVKMYKIECVKCGAPAENYIDNKTGHKVYKLQRCVCGGFFSPNFSKVYWEEE